MFAVLVCRIEEIWNFDGCWLTITSIAIGLVTPILSYVALAWLGLIIISLSFEGSGHPPLPNAPDWLYVLVFVVVAPVITISIGIMCAMFSQRKISR